MGGQLGAEVLVSGRPGIDRLVGIQIPAIQHPAAGFIVGLSGFAVEQFHIRCAACVVVDRGVDLIAGALTDKATGGKEMGHRYVAGI